MKQIPEDFSIYKTNDSPQTNGWFHHSNVCISITNNESHGRLFDKDVWIFNINYVH